eukprot:g29823.t1
MASRPPVICDTGTGVIKAGMAGEQEPSVMLPNLLGRPVLRADGMVVGQADDIMIGDEANAARSMLQLSRPIQNGVVKDWNEMEAVWDYTFKKLGIENPADHKVLQTEAALNPPRNREKMVEIMFERYGFSGVNVSVQAILALNSRGLQSGFVVDSGDGVTHLVPVTEGYLEPALVQRVNLAGRHVTEQLMKLLVGQGHPLNSTTDFETVREVKQKLCYVAYDPEAEKKLARETTLVDRQYVLPDSRTMRVGAERFLAPEILFKPALAGHGDTDGLADLVFNTIRRSDIHVSPVAPTFAAQDLKALYLQNVLQGDSSRASKFRVHVEDPPHRQHMVFLGASIMADACEHQANSKFWISRQEYQEVGAGAVHRLIPTRLA